MTKIDKSGLKFGLEPIYRDRRYLDRLRERPCIFSGRTVCNDPAHIGTAGRGLKTHDFEAIPLDHDLHMLQEGQIGAKSGFLAALNAVPPEQAEYALREILKDAAAFQFIQDFFGGARRFHMVMRIKKGFGK